MVLCTNCWCNFLLRPVPGQSIMSGEAPHSLIAVCCKHTSCMRQAVESSDRLSSGFALQLFKKPPYRAAALPCF